MTDPRLSFMRAIIASPDDDSVRLVYADWLDEHGDAAERARAEFIRVQCRLAKLPKFDRNHKGDVLKYSQERLEAWSLESRGQELLNLHGFDWFRETFNGIAEWNGDVMRYVWTFTMMRGRTVTGPVSKAVFRRGFPSAVSLRADEVVRYGRQLAELTPLEMVTVTDREPYRASDGRLPSWFWYNGHNGRSSGWATATRSSIVPIELWPPDAQFVLEFTSGQAARDALNQWALTYAREGAGRLAVEV